MVGGNKQIRSTRWIRSVPDLASWNKALLLKDIWDVVCRKESLWITWIHSVKLKHHKMLLGYSYSSVVFLVLAIVTST